MNKIAIILTLLPVFATAQKVGPALGYIQQTSHLYAVGIQTADQGRRATWGTEWAATTNRDGLHGLFASVGPRYRIGGFELGASGSLLLPLFAKSELDQTTRLYFSPVVAVRNGPAVLSLSFMPQVFPVQKKAYALRASVAYMIK